MSKKALVVLFLFFSFNSFAQQPTGEVRKDIRSLRSLSYAQYVKKAIAFSQFYFLDGRQEDAEKFVDLAAKKGKREGGALPMAAVYIIHTDDLLVCCKNDINAQKFALTSISLANESDKKGILNEELFSRLKIINSLSKEPAVLARINEIAESLGLASGRIEELSNTTLVATETRELHNEVNEKLDEISKLSEESAKQKLLIEYQDRVVQNMAYESMLDSVMAVQNEQQLAQQDAIIGLQQSQGRTLQLIVGLVVLSLLFLGWQFWQSKKFNKTLQEQKSVIATEKERADDLLLNILPSHVAEELKESGTVEPRHYQFATVLFTDFKGFSEIAKTYSIKMLISDLDECFSAWDKIGEEYHIEKIKTIGDSYMCTGGLNLPYKEALFNVIEFALAIQNHLKEWNKERLLKGAPAFEARIGIHNGPMVAGVVGKKKFAFDIWGDTVNVASRMESEGEPNRVNVSENIFALAGKQFSFKERGKISVKNMADMNMYFVEEI